jgi:uncharacterized protein DUF4394/Calx-beta domain-containing protein
MRHTIKRLPLLASVAAACLCAVPALAAAQPAVGVLFGSNTLATFDTNAPGTFTSLRQISGLADGEQIQAIDFRDRPAPSEPPSTEALYGLAIVPGTPDTGRLYRIDIGTGTATAVGASFSVPASTAWDIDFDAATDKLRLVTDADVNMGIDPGTGATTVDADINPSAAEVVAIAADEDVPGRVTVLRGVEVQHSLVQIDTATGNIATFAFHGLTINPSSRVGYDYTPYDPASPSAQLGYITLSTALGTGGLYALHPSGSMDSTTFLGNLADSIRAFALLPPATAEFSGGSLAAQAGDRVTVTVTRSGPATSTQTIAYATGGGTATAGVDYAPVSGELTFAPGETSRTFDVQLLPDLRAEQDETIGLALSSPSPALTLGGRATATLVIHGEPRVAPALLQLSPMSQGVGIARLLRGGLRVVVTPAHPVHALEVSLMGTTRRAVIARRGNLVLASRSYAPLLDHPRAFRLKPDRRLLGHPRRSFRLRIEVTAIDATGQPVSVSRVVRVTVPRRRR